MRLALCPALKPGVEGEAAYPPLGLGYLAAAVARALPRVEVRICRSEAGVEACGPDMVGISSVSENFSLAEAMARRLKETTGARIIVGGIHASSLPGSLSDAFDAAVVGEGEETLVDLLRQGGAWQGIPGTVVRTGDEWIVAKRRPLIEPLDLLPHPDREALARDWETAREGCLEAHMVTSRGCSHRCVFCSSTRFWGAYRQFSASYVIREIEQVVDRYRPRTIRFFDDLFIVDRLRLREIHDEVRRRGLHERVGFTGYVRASVFDREVCQLLRGMNFGVLSFGAESGSDRILAGLKGRGTCVRDNQQVLDLCRAHGLLVSASFVIGVPGETESDLRATFDFIERNEQLLFDVQVFPLAPYPGTAFWALARRRRVLRESGEDWSRLSILIGDLDPLRYPYLNEEHVPLAIFLRWVARFQELSLRVKPYPERVMRMVGAMRAGGPG